MNFVIDSNIFLHYKMFTNLDWKSLLNNDDLTLYVPPTIVKELDEEKFNNQNSKIRTRAQEVISKLTKIKKKEINSIGMKIEFSQVNNQFKWEDHGLNPINQDDRIIGELIYLKEILDDENICLVTSDLGMELKAEQYNIKVINPPEDWKREVKDIRDKEINKLKLEIKKLQHKKPNLELFLSSERELVELIKIHKNELLKHLMTDKDIEDELNKKEIELKLKTKISPMVSGLFHIPQEEIKRFEKESDEFITEYKTYLDNLKKHKEFKASILKISPALINNGNDVADDIDIFLQFPDNIELFTEIDIPEPPDIPEEPKPPKIMFGTFRNDFLHPFAIPKLDELVLRSYPSSGNEINETGPTIDNNKKEAKYWKKRLKHGLEWHGESVYVKFSSINDLKSFEIEYSIHVSNVQEIKDGKLNIVIE